MLARRAAFVFFNIVLPHVLGFESENAPGFGRVDTTPVCAACSPHLCAFRQIALYQFCSRLDHTTVRRRDDESLVIAEIRSKRQAASRRRIARVDVGPEAVR